MSESKAQRRIVIKAAIVTATVVSVLLVLFTVCLIVNHRIFLSSSSYEAAQKYVSSLSRKNLGETVTEFVRESITPYEDENEVISVFVSDFEKGEITIARGDDFDASNPVYNVYVNGRYAFDLLLENKAPSFLSPLWKVKELLVPENAELGRELVIDVPAGSILVVNGIEVGRAKADPVPYHSLTEFEGELKDTYYSDRYSLGSFYLSPDVSVVYEGERLRAQDIENGVMRFAYPQAVRRSLTLTVPFGSVVKLNSVEVGRAYKIKTGVEYPFLTRFEADAGSVITCETYHIAGLFGETEVEVVYNGEALTESVDGAYKLPPSQTYGAVIAVPSYATVKINGVVLSGGEVTNKKFELPIMENVSGSSKVRPYMTEYKVEGLLFEPEISVTDESGKPLKVSPYYSTEDRIFYSCSESGSLPSKENKLITNFAKAYVKYVYSANNGLSDNYNKAISYVPYSSLAYSTLQSTYRTLYNAPQYKSISYSTLKVVSYHSYSQSSYSAIVTLPFSAVRNGAKQNFEITLEVLCNYSGSRRVINYKVLENKQV